MVVSARRGDGGFRNQKPEDRREKSPFFYLARLRGRSARALGPAPGEGEAAVGFLSPLKARVTPGPLQCHAARARQESGWKANPAGLGSAPMYSGTGTRAF